MRNGALRDIIEQWRKNTVKNDYGELTEQWVKLRDLRVYVHRKYGDTITDNDEVFNTVTVTISLRNQADIIENDRLLIDNDFYYIDFIQPDDTNRWLTVRCTKLNE